jgi:hypothetical protein
MLDAHWEICRALTQLSCFTVMLSMTLYSFVRTYHIRATGCAGDYKSVAPDVSTNQFVVCDAAAGGCCMRYLGSDSGAGRIVSFDSSYSPGVRTDRTCMNLIIDAKRCPTNCAAGLDASRNVLECSATGFDLPAYTASFVPTFTCARGAVSRIAISNDSAGGAAGRGALSRIAITNDSAAGVAERGIVSRIAISDGTAGGAAGRDL